MKGSSPTLSSLSANSVTSASIFSSTTSISNYAIDMVNRELSIADTTVSFANCEFDLEKLFLPSVASGTMTLNASNTLKVQYLTFTQTFTLNVANLELTKQISRLSTYSATLNPIISETSAKWIFTSSLTISKGVTIDMNGLNELQFFLENSNGASVETDTSQLTRVYLRPNKLSIVWMMSSPPEVAIAHKLFQSSTTLDIPSTTTVVPFIDGPAVYHGLLEKIVLASSPPGTLGGQVSIRVIQTGLPLSPIFLTSILPEYPYLWDGSSCTTTSTVCGSDMPCYVPENFVSSIPSSGTSCLLLLNAFDDREAYNMTFELPAMQSGSQISLAANGGLSKGKFQFRPKTGTSTSSPVIFVSNPLVTSENDGFDFTNTSHGVQFSGFPSSFSAFFNAKLVNPRIIFSGGTITFGQNTTVLADAEQYIGGKTPITFLNATLNFVFGGGTWTATSVDSSLLPSTLISGTSSTVTTSGAGPEISNFQISSANFVLESSTLNYVTLNATVRVNLTQSTLEDSIVGAAKLSTKHKTNLISSTIELTSSLDSSETLFEKTSIRSLTTVD